MRLLFPFLVILGMTHIGLELFFFLLFLHALLFLLFGSKFAKLDGIFHFIAGYAHGRVTFTFVLTTSVEMLFL